MASSIALDSRPMDSMALPAGLDDLPRSGRLDVLCLRPIHHVLEYEALFRLMAALRERAPEVEVYLHLRSALCDDAPFARLPVRRVTRLTEQGGRGELASGLRRVIRGWEPGAAALVLAPPSGWRRVAVGARIFTAPFDFQSPGCGESEECAAAGTLFLDALNREMPLWRVAADAPRWLDRSAAGPRFLIHQARFHIGDVLWLTPLLRALHDLFEKPEITVVGPPVAATVLAGNPHVAGILAHHPREGEAGQRRVLGALAGRPFDAALFTFARRSESRWLMRAMAAAGVPWRINLEYHDAYLDSRRVWEEATHEGWFFWGAMPSPRMLLHAVAPLIESFDVEAGASAQDPSSPRPSSPIALPPAGRRGRKAKTEERGVSGPAGRRRSQGVWLELRRGSPSSPGVGGAEGAGEEGRGDEGLRVGEAGVEESLELYVSGTAQRQAGVLLDGLGLAGGPFAVLSPGGFSSRRWPAASFARLAVAMSTEFGLAVLIEGSPEEAPLLREVEAAVGEGCRNLHFRQDPLDVFAALVARARLVVTNDSAPLHFAAALGVPTLYFAQREKLVHSQPASARCVALYDALENDLGRISVERALAAAREILTRQFPSPTRQ